MAGAAPTAMAPKEMKATLDCVRAAALACHSAAGFLAGSGDRQHARMLRAAEALARSAAASLVLAPSVAARNDAPTQVQRKKRPRRRKKKDGDGQDLGSQAERPQFPSSAPPSAHGDGLDARWMAVDAVGEAPPAQVACLKLASPTPVAFSSASAASSVAGVQSVPPASLSEALALAEEKGPEAVALLRSLLALTGVTVEGVGSGKGKGGRSQCGRGMGQSASKAHGKKKR